MKNYKVVLVSIYLFACNTNSNSFPQKSLGPEQIIEKFFDVFISEGTDPALEYILSTNQWINDGDIELKSSVKKLISQLGTYNGKELIVKRSIGDNYILWSFMIRYDRQPIRFQFIFYRPSTKWQLQDFRYDDDLGIELIEAANAYRLMENLPGN